MKDRCLNPSHDSYGHYGAKGVTICERWLIFENFLADMGERPAGRYSIDRIDNSRGYEPGNCRWATLKQQNENRRSNRLLTHDGLTLTLTDWAKRLGLSKQAISARLRAGWPVDRALAQPKTPGKGPKPKPG